MIRAILLGVSFFAFMSFAFAEQWTNGGLGGKKIYSEYSEYSENLRAFMKTRLDQVEQRKLAEFMKANSAGKSEVEAVESLNTHIKSILNKQQTSEFLEFMKANSSASAEERGADKNMKAKIFKKDQPNSEYYESGRKVLPKKYVSKIVKNGYPGKANVVFEKTYAGCVSAIQKLDSARGEAPTILIGKGYIVRDEGDGPVIYTEDHSTKPELGGDRSCAHGTLKPTDAIKAALKKSIETVDCVECQAQPIDLPKINEYRSIALKDCEAFADGLNSSGVNSSGSKSDAVKTPKVQ